MVAVGRGAQAGVLIKNAEALERMERIDTLIIDKTWTLTEGKPRVTAVRLAPGFAQDEVLRFAASLERNSQHPLGAAVVQAAQERKIALADVHGFDAPIGKGVTGSLDGHRLVIGNARMLRGSPAGAIPRMARAGRINSRRAAAYRGDSNSATGTSVNRGSAMYRSRSANASFSASDTM